MKWNMRTTSLVGSISLIIILTIVGKYLSQKFTNHLPLSLVESPKPSMIHEIANVQFSKVAEIDSSYELNDGLTVERMGSAAIAGLPTPSTNSVSLLILNHTQEPIVFENIGFGVQVFQYNPTPPEWTKVKIPYTPEKTAKILPPKTENFNFKVLNSWEFDDRDFINVDSSMIRILIKGQGENTGKNYGAYIDVTLQK